MLLCKQASTVLAVVEGIVLASCVGIVLADCVCVCVRACACMQQEEGVKKHPTLVFGLQ